MFEKIQSVRSAVEVIKAAILKSQSRAAQTVIQEQLALYYGIGRFISQNSRKGFWGKDAIGNISRRLKMEMPGLRGFSAENIKLMRRFYEAWELLEINSVVTTTELQSPQNEADAIQSLQLTNYRDFPVTAFLNISFTHHIAILRHTETIEERKYYIQLAYNQRMKVDDLEVVLKSGVYHHRDNLPNNFFKVIPDKHQALATLQMLIKNKIGTKLFLEKCF